MIKSLQKCAYLALLSGLTAIPANAAEGEVSLAEKAADPAAALPAIAAEGALILTQVAADPAAALPAIAAESAVTLAQEAAEPNAVLPANAAEGEMSLAQKAADPTAALMAFNFKYSLTDLQDIPQDINALQFQPVVPFKAFGVANILRPTITYETSGPSGARLADVTIFNLSVFDRPWGRWGIGPVMQMRGGNNTPGPFAIGPAVGFVMNRGPWTLGLFNQNLFGSDTAISSIQPVVAYQLGKGWALSSGEAQFTMDWKRGRLVNLPIGVALSKVGSIGGQAMKFSINPEYNVLSVSGAPDFSIRAGFTLLVPTG